MYSSAKKKPGPARGTRKASRRVGKSAAKAPQPSISHDLDDDEHVSSFLSDIFVNSPATEPVLAVRSALHSCNTPSQSVTLASAITPVDPTVGASRYTELRISPEMQAKLQVPLPSDIVSMF